MIQQINQSTKIALFGHQNPDGDAIWSVLAMRQLLLNQWKIVNCFTPDQPSQMFNFLDSIDEIKDEFDYGIYDCLIFLDFSGYHRIAKFTLWHEAYFDQQTKIIIDHHINPDPPGQINLIDTTASSNCEWIYEIIVPYWTIDSAIATYLYLWLTTDTGNFVYEKNSVRTMKIALELLTHGANKSLIIDNLRRSKSLGQIQFLSCLIERIQCKWWVCVTRCTEKDLEYYHIDQEQASFGLGIIQSVNDAYITLLIKQVGNFIHWSLRSKSINNQKAIDVNHIAHSFGWGGHLQAAGFRIPLQKDLEQQIGDICNQVQWYLT